MPEFVTITEKIERRTYLKGRFTGKFAGLLDEPSSDLKNENFYDLEITDAKIFASRTDFRPWQQGGEFEEFQKVERFLTRLPETMPCEVTDPNGIVKHFNLRVHEPKLKNYRLFNRLCEKNELFTTIEGEISGYLKHYDTEERIEEIVPPPERIADEKTGSPINRGGFENLVSRAKSYGGAYSAADSRSSAASNRGCAAIGFSSPSSGCLSLIAIVFAAYLILGFIALTLTALSKLFIAAGLIAALLFSVIFPLIAVAVVLYLFVKIQSRLSPVWKWFFRLITAFLILFLWFN